MNLFKARADWPIPPAPASSVKVENTEVPPPNISNPPWGLHCPICKKEEEDSMEYWNGDRQRDQHRNHYPQNTQHHQAYDVPD